MRCQKNERKLCLITLSDYFRFLLFLFFITGKKPLLSLLGVVQKIRVQLRERGGGCIDKWYRMSQWGIGFFRGLEGAGGGVKMVRKFYTYFFNGPFCCKLLNAFQVCGSIGFFNYFFDILLWDSCTCFNLLLLLFKRSVGETFGKMINRTSNFERLSRMKGAKFQFICKYYILVYKYHALCKLKVPYLRSMVSYFGSKGRSIRRKSVDFCSLTNKKSLYITCTTKADILKLAMTLLFTGLVQLTMLPLSNFHFYVEEKFHSLAFIILSNLFT